MDYFWCQLQNGDKRTVGYIEKRGAVVGKLVELVDLDGEMWEVVGVSKKGVSKEYMRDQETRFKDFQGSLKGGVIQ